MLSEGRAFGNSPLVSQRRPELLLLNQWPIYWRRCTSSKGNFRRSGCWQSPGQGGRCTPEDDQCQGLPAGAGFSGHPTCGSSTAGEYYWYFWCRSSVAPRSEAIHSIFICSSTPTAACAAIISRPVRLLWRYAIIWIWSPTTGIYGGSQRRFQLLELWNGIASPSDQPTKESSTCRRFCQSGWVWKQPANISD